MQSSGGICTERLQRVRQRQHKDREQAGKIRAREGTEYATALVVSLPRPVNLQLQVAHHPPRLPTIIRCVRSANVTTVTELVTLKQIALC